MGIWRSRSMDGRVAVIKFVVYIVKEQGIKNEARKRVAV